MMRCNLTSFFTVLGKEITDLRRDPRTLLVSVLLPLILFPLVFTITGDIGIPETAFNAETVNKAEALHRGSVLLSMVLPFIIMVFSSACPLPFAADLSAGEKERQSLEALLSTAGPGWGIMLGKLIASSIAGFISLCAFFGGLALAFMLNPAIAGSKEIIFSISPFSIFLLICAARLTVYLFSGIELLLGLLARSTREAQLMGMPVLIAGGAMVYAAQKSAEEAAKVLYHLPLVNLALLIRNIPLNTVTPGSILTVFLWSLFYILLLILAGSALLQREETLLGS